MSLRYDRHQLCFSDSCDKKVMRLCHTQAPAGPDDVVARPTSRNRVNNPLLGFVDFRKVLRGLQAGIDTESSNITLRSWGFLENSPGASKGAFGEAHI